ncbi:carbohydrate ABC transporter permease [Halopelagius fulvigenes]|uniref:Carbohydrate ABC transporter permease n=1 Tax=Halopelagius fulvigenes TaxID=1198324 RepID=A0ABD5TYK0_9EURY
MVITSFLPNDSIFSLPPTLLPTDLTLDHYRLILSPEIIPFVQFFINSLLVSLIVAALSVIVATFGAYSFSRLDYPGHRIISRGVLIVYMFSGILLVVPLFKVMAWLGLVDSLASVVLAYLVFGLPLSLWLLGSYFNSLPIDIEEASMMDGYSRVETIFRITIPLSAPALVAVFLYTFLIAWNEYLFASIFLKTRTNYTLPIGIEAIYASSVTNTIWGNLMAASVLATIPVLILFFKLESFLTEVSFGSGK